MQMTQLFMLQEKNLTNLKNDIENDLNYLHAWFRSNKLSLNVKKTFFMYFSHGKANTLDLIKFGQVSIKNVSNFKFLGIIIDDKLTWNKHIEHVHKKVSSGLYAIRMLKKLLPSLTLRTLYFSLINCHLIYGANLWGNTYKYLINPIVILQKKQ